jgi:Cof subfamily protein (haloacid dehalogenase superfamily)
MAQNRKISLLLADVDGTLVTSDKVLTERARKAVHALHDRRIRFAITSGRPPRGMGMLIEPLAIDTPIGGFNGGSFVNPDLSIIETRTLPADVAKSALALIEQHGLDCWLYVGNDWLLRDPKAPHVAREAWTVKFEPTVVTSFDDKQGSVLKIVGVSDDLDRVKRAEAAAQQALGDHASAARSQSYYLDVTHREANKGFVIRYLSKALNIPPAEIATIGDQPNDLLMFRPSGFSIAMGNAPDEVKRQASAVTDSYDDEGFAKAVEKYILGGRLER